MLGLFVLLATAAGFLAGGAALPFAAAANAMTSEAVTVFNDVPDELRPSELSQASTVYAADGSKLAVFYARNRIVVPLDEVSQYLINAVVSIEDERFYEHAGIDPHGVMRAVVNNLLHRPQQGASTLTQQYVKNMLIAEAEAAGDPFGIIEARADSMVRKAREMKLAIGVEQQMTKDEILQGYLNVAQFGYNNIYGVETAARYFFNKHAKDLGAVEAATIAGITKSPANFDPSRPENLEMATMRRNAVLYKMWQLGHLDTAEYNTAIATPLESTLRITPVPTGCQAAAGAAFFCVYVISEIRTNPVFGATEAERLALLYRGGLSIYTTLEVPLQRAAEEILAERVPADNEAGLDSVIVTVEPGTGRILAMAQNIPFDGRSNPDPHTTALNYAADPTHGASKGFQPGSTFKPLVLAEWLRAGNTLNDMVDANKVKRPQSAWHASCAQMSGDDWGPANAEGNRGGTVSVLQATAESINTAYASMSVQLDLCGVRNTAWDLGFRPTTKNGPNNTVITLFNSGMDDILVTPAMSLGTQTTSPLSLASAYATLAANGTYCSPVAITSVMAADGTELRVPEANCKQNALEPNVAATVTYALSQVFKQGGTAARFPLAGGRPAAGKTGTNQGAAQTWFAGYTPQLATVVWVGEADGEVPHFNITLLGRHIRVLYASTVALPMWQEYMDQVLEGVEPLPFPAPDPALVGKPKPPPAPPGEQPPGEQPPGEAPPPEPSPTEPLWVVEPAETTKSPG